ncbi:MAG: hypothetical protein NTX85_00455 [Candidatus Nomurabacteria bacterium]|nr:hypothetical protein [Candidatus Nomurabacteria bacterium]
MEEKQIQTISWTSPEYIQKEKSIDWFWTIGLVSLMGFCIAIYFGNYLFAVLILVSGGIFFLLQIHTPRDVECEINNEVIKIGNINYQIKSIKYFDIKNNEIPTLLIYTSDRFMPIKSIQIQKESSKEIEKELIKFVEKKEIQESHAVKFMETLGF